MFQPEPSGSQSKQVRCFSVSAPKLDCTRKTVGCLGVLKDLLLGDLISDNEVYFHHGKNQHFPPKILCSCTNRATRHSSVRLRCIAKIILLPEGVLLGTFSETEMGSSDKLEGLPQKDNAKKALWFETELFCFLTQIRGLTWNLGLVLKWKPSLVGFYIKP